MSYLINRKLTNTNLAADIAATSFVSKNFETDVTNTSDITINLPTTRYNLNSALGLDGEIFTVKNLGTGIINLTIADGHYYNSGIYYQTYLRHSGDYDTTGIGVDEPTSYQIKPFHHVQVHCKVTVNDSSIKRLTYNIVPVGGPLFPFQIEDVSSAATGLKTNYLYVCDTTSGAFTVTLQDRADVGDGERIDIKNIGSNTLTIDAYSTQRIDGEYSITLEEHDSVTLVKKGTAWISFTSALGNIGFSSSNLGYSAISTSTTAATGFHYSCTGTLTLTLPTSGALAGERIRVKNMGTGTITVDPDTQTIDGSTNDYEITTQYASITFVSTGTNWEII